MKEEAVHTLFGEVAQDKWEHDVWLMARRAALIYHYMANAIIERLGPEEGRALVKDAIWQYGEHCGRTTRNTLEALGLPVTLENFSQIPDLPSRGWRWEPRTLPDGSSRTAVTLCPLARTWFDIGTDPSVARIYCWVDQSKIAGFNDEEYECVHDANVLDGDQHCEVVMRPKSK